MDSKEEVKWFRGGGSFYYIPERYRALIASIVAAFLFYNAFEILFQSQSSGPGACGTLLRPVLYKVDEDGYEFTPIGWIWDTGGNIFSLNEGIQCPRVIQNLWWEWFATIGGLIACGFVLRAAIKREEAAELD